MNGKRMPKRVLVKFAIFVLGLSFQNSIGLLEVPMCRTQSCFNSVAPFSYSVRHKDWLIEECFLGVFYDILTELHTNFHSIDE